jgi:uncharacterized membrane protein
MDDTPLCTLNKGISHAFMAILLGLAFTSPVLSVQNGSPVVHAVLFASPTCAHCAKVREEVLPPLVARYGSQLQIAIVSTATPAGYELFLSACMQHGLLRQSVPLLIVGKAHLVGDVDIPSKFPDLIEKHLSTGGVDWPRIPGLAAMLASNPSFSSDVQPSTGQPPAAEGPAAMPSASLTNTAASDQFSVRAPAGTEEKMMEPKAITAAPAQPAPKSKPGPVDRDTADAVKPPIHPVPDNPPNPGSAPAPLAAGTKPSGIIDLTGGDEPIGVIGRIRQDVYGNGLAILMLAGMLVTLLLSPMILRKSGMTPSGRRVFKPDLVIPILALAGLAVAFYLSHVELRKVEAICGPVGDCNTVQQSEYARLFGILPVGVLGLVGFLAILIVWILRRWGSDRISSWAAVSMLGMTGFGTLFSVYLTFLEPFVIGATCLWCLSSALIMTMLYVIALKPARQAWSALVRTNAP